MEKWTKARMIELLDENDQAVRRGIVVIHSYQTASEQASHTTTESNGVGWSGFDADFMTSLANQLKTRNALSDRQMEVGRAKMKKYAGQLVRIANANMEAA